MSTFTVQLTRRAVADLDKVPEKARAQIIKDVSKLATHPFANGKAKKKLRGYKFRVYRLRSGDYRIIYRIDRALVTVMRVIDRKDLERIIKRLNLPAK